MGQKGERGKEGRKAGTDIAESVLGFVVERRVEFEGGCAGDEGGRGGTISVGRLMVFAHGEWM